MANITSALLIVLGINVIMFLAQTAILDLDSEGTSFYNCEGSIIAGFDKNNCTTSLYVLNDDDPKSVLPTGAKSVDPDTGNIFTDAFTGVKTWLLDSTGISYLTNMLSAPTNILKAIGVPSAFSFAIGALWYGITLFLLVAFLFGRDA